MVRVVLYCEGSREGGRRAAQPDAPGDRLDEEALGPAHILCRRAIAARTLVPEAAVHFEAPLRTHRGTVPQGSDLLVRKTLRRLLTWPSTRSLPDLAVVLVDRDGDEGRAALLRNHVGDLVLPRRVIGVAIEEFEAWLIADAATIEQITALPVSAVASPEHMVRGAAKSQLAKWSAGSSAPQVHREVASRCDLNVVCRHCRAFESFSSDLQQALIT